jgi:hypothetical protein
VASESDLELAWASVMGWETELAQAMVTAAVQEQASAAALELDSGSPLRPESHGRPHPRP